MTISLDLYLFLLKINNCQQFLLHIIYVSDIVLWANNIAINKIATMPTFEQMIFLNGEKGNKPFSF